MLGLAPINSNFKRNYPFIVYKKKLVMLDFVGLQLIKHYFIMTSSMAAF